MEKQFIRQLIAALWLLREEANEKCHKPEVAAWCDDDIEYVECYYLEEPSDSSYTQEELLPEYEHGKRISFQEAYETLNMRMSLTLDYLGLIQS